MDQYTMMDILGKAFADGEIDALRPLMAADCDYASQYANKSFSGASEILSNMESVHKNIDETCAYTYKVIDLSGQMAYPLLIWTIKPECIPAGTVCSCISMALIILLLLLPV